MTTKYLVVQNDQPVDGEFKDREAALNALPLCDAFTEVLEFDLDDAMRGGGSEIHNVTHQLILEGHAQAWWTREEIEKSVLCYHITLPISREEQRADDADARRHE